MNAHTQTAIELNMYERAMPHKHMADYAHNAQACCRLHDALKDDRWLEEAMVWRDRFNAVADYADTL